MNIRFLFSCLLCWGLASTVQAQDPIAHYTFDACDESDLMGNYINNQSEGSPICDCGPVNNAFYFNGIDQFVTLDGELKSILSGDFTLSFYFWLEPSPMRYNVFAIKKPDCIDRDSTMHVQYLPNIESIEFDFTRISTDPIRFVAPVNTENCWHHVVITKEQTNYSFYLDQEFVGSEDLTRHIIMADSAQVFIGNTECDGGGEALFNGRFDELKFFNRALNNEEIRGLDLMIDQIITDNTTIFTGESVPLFTGGTCGNFTWSSPGDFDDPTLLNPILTPQSSATYTFSVDHGSCQTMDTLLVNVLDLEDLDCQNLLLPKAFSPNGDGLNDTYKISNDFIIDELISFEIFDRWGTRVFQTTEIDQGWNGFYKNADLNSTSFVYKVTYICQSEEQVSVGNFTILR